MITIMQTFNALLSLINKTDMLTAEEREKVYELCDQFGTQFPATFPERGIYRKIHVLVFDVPKFVR